LDNTPTPMMSTPISTPTPVDSVNAINTLTVQAMAPSAGPNNAISTAVNIASTNINPHDSLAITALQKLAQNAKSTNAGNVQTVQKAMTTAIQAVNNNLPSVVTPKSAITAIQLLSNFALTPGPVSNTVVMTASNTAISAIPPNSVKAITAVQSLASQAITPKPINSSIVKQWAHTALQGITSNSTAIPIVNPTQADSGCYPARHFDMSKVDATVDNTSNEYLSPFVPTTN